MQQYTLAVWAPKGVSVLDPLILLGEGLNTFSVFVDDIQAVVDLLQEEGCLVKSVNHLDIEAVTVTDMLLPGESLLELGL